MPEDEKAPEAPEVEEKEEETSDAADAMMKMMRMQYGVMMGGAKGATGLARLAEKFLDALGGETKVTEADLTDFLKNLPEGVASATKKTLEEAEDLPQEMVDAYRQYAK